MTQKIACVRCGQECRTASSLCRGCQVSAEKTLFIDYYRQYGAVGQAAKLAGISRRLVYLWMDSDPEFKAIYEDELKPNRTDEIVSTLYQAAMGHLPLTVSQVTSAIFLLKAFDPKTFAEKYQISGAGGSEAVKIEFVLEKPDGEPKSAVISRAAVPQGAGDGHLSIQSPG